MAILDNPVAIAARQAALKAPHIEPLERWRADLLPDHRRVPHFDPADGGASARLLLLLETPGPGAAPVRFVSIDNPTGTARNLRRCLSDAGIARSDLVLWNTVPWIVHAPGARNRSLRRAEIVEGLALLPSLLDQLRCVRVVVLAGRVAGLAAPSLSRQPAMTVLEMPHPSPTNVCTSPNIASHIGETLKLAAARLDGCNA